MARDISDHDRFFKRSMQYHHVAEDFFRSHLPLSLQKAIDWDSLKLESSDFINEEQDSAHVDMLYSVKLFDKTGYLYILSEHQSTPDRFMPLRLWKYMCRIWDRHRKQYPGKSYYLPLIYPVTLYHGRKSPYPYSMDLFDLFKDKKMAESLLRHDPFPLIDLTMLSDDDLKKNGSVAVMELLLKHVFTKDMLDVFKLLAEAEAFRLVDHLGGGVYITELLQYALKKGEVSSTDDLLKTLVEAVPEEEDRIMTGAEQLIQKGMQQGMEQGLELGKLEAARSMFALGVDAGVITKATGLPKVAFAKNTEEL